MDVKISLSMPEDEAYIGLIREIGRVLLKHHDTAPQDIDDVETVLGELCANVTRHAASPHGFYQVALEHHADRVVVIVSDNGRGFDPAQVAPAGAEHREKDGTVRHGGYGLHLVRALSDQVEFQTSHPSGTTVRAVKALRRQEAQEMGRHHHAPRKGTL